MVGIERVEQQLEEMQREIVALRAEVERLRSTDAAPAPTRTDDTPGPARPGGMLSSRRQLLTGGAIAAGVGVVGAGLVAHPAVAADGDTVRVGQSHTGSASTKIRSSGPSADAFAGYADATSGPAWGIRGETRSPEGYGVRGYNSAPEPLVSDPDSRPVGVYGQANSIRGVGVEGTVTESDAQAGSSPIGVYGHVIGFHNATGVRGEVTSRDSEASGVLGITNDAGWGVLGSYGGAGDEFSGGVWGLTTAPSTVGVRASHFGSEGVAIEAESDSGLGALLAGGLAPLKLAAAPGAPTASIRAHTFGELYVDQETRNLWYCSKSGTPGTWVKLSAAPVTLPPLLRPVDPFRVYDSRKPGQGPLRLGSTRLVNVRDSIDLKTYDVLVTDAVPPGATAVTFNLTVFNTVGGGFVAATPGNAATFGTASVNWTGPNQAVGNATLVTLDGQRRMKIFIDGVGGAAVDFTVDITGYFK